jgi:hypothetical protein
MSRRMTVVVLIACLFMVACDADTLGYVEKAKYDALQKQLEKREADLKAAQDQVSACQAHKYEIYRSAFRTWRLDTVTGATCILLTTDDDWKKPATVAAGCF